MPTNAELWPTPVANTTGSKLDQSIVILALVMMFRELLIPSSMKVSNSLGEVGFTWRPSSVRRSATDGVSEAFLIAALSLSMIGFGVLAGAATPSHPREKKPGRAGPRAGGT